MGIGIKLANLTNYAQHGVKGNSTAFTLFSLPAIYRENMKKIIMLFCNLLLLSCLSFAQDQYVNNITDKIEKFDFVLFFTENKISHSSNKLKSYTGKINYEKFKIFVSNYISVSSSGFCPYTYYSFYHKNKLISFKQIEEMRDMSSYDVFLTDIKPVKEKYKAFKSLKKYKIFRKKLSEKENIYILDVDDEIQIDEGVQSLQNDKSYGLKWCKW